MIKENFNTDYINRIFDRFLSSYMIITNMNHFDNNGLYSYNYALIALRKLLDLNVLDIKRFKFIKDLLLEDDIAEFLAVGYIKFIIIDKLNYYENTG